MCINDINLLVFTAMQNPGSTSAGPSVPNQGIPPTVVTDGIPANKH